MSPLDCETALTRVRRIGSGGATLDVTEVAIGRVDRREPSVQRAPPARQRPRHPEDERPDPLGLPNPPGTPPLDRQQERILRQFAPRVLRAEPPPPERHQPPAVPPGRLGLLIPGRVVSGGGHAAKGGRHRRARVVLPNLADGLGSCRGRGYGPGDGSACHPERRVARPLPHHSPFRGRLAPARPCFSECEALYCQEHVRTPTARSRDQRRDYGTARFPCPGGGARRGYRKPPDGWGWQRAWWARVVIGWIGLDSNGQIWKSPVAELIVVRRYEREKLSVMNSRI